MFSYQNLKKFLCFFAITSLFFHNIYSNEAVETLQKELQKAIFHIDPTAKIGIKVVSLKDGKTLFEKNSEKKFIPGGILKLVTVAAALDVLGPSYCFETKLLSNGSVEDGVLKGNLYLEGSGDPSISDKALDDLIFQLKIMNIKEIDGDIIFDTSEFDELTLAPGWMWDDKIEYRDAPVEALTINHSCINVWVKPTNLVTMSPMVYVYPEIPGIVIENEASMGNIGLKQSSLKVGKKNDLDQDIIYISGTMPIKSETQKFKIPVKNPHLYVATQFCETLKRNKIKFKGKVKFESVPIKCDVIASCLSDPIFKLVMHTLKNSDNLYANCLFKKLGRTKFGKPGTWPNGSQAIRDFLFQINPKVYSDLAILDGSGESRYNKLTPSQVVNFLVWTNSKFSFSPELLAAMPLAGVDAILRKRLREKKFQAKARVVSGTLQGVSSLCGYMTTIDNEILAFAIMSNGFIKTTKEIKTEIEDTVCHILSNFSRR